MTALQVVAQGRHSLIEAATTQDRAAEAISFGGDITLMEGWTSINPDRTFTNQRFDLRLAIKASRLERDGRLSVTCSPMNVTWYGGRCEDLKGVTRVRIVSGDYVLVDEAFASLRGHPKIESLGVSFDVTTESWA